jgi:hypothetical protein
LILDRFSDPGQVLLIAMGNRNGDDLWYLIGVQLAYPLLKLR